jgi:hypothetical protein
MPDLAPKLKRTPDYPPSCSLFQVMVYCNQLVTIESPTQRTCQRTKRMDVGRWVWRETATPPVFGKGTRLPGRFWRPFSGDAIFFSQDRERLRKGRAYR